MEQSGVSRMPHVMPRVVESEGYVMFIPSFVVRQIAETVDYAAGKKDCFSNKFAEKQAEEMMREIFLPGLQYFIARIVRNHASQPGAFLLMEVTGAADKASMEYADTETLMSFIRRDIGRIIQELIDARVKVALIFMTRTTTEGCNILVRWNYENPEKIAMWEKPDKS
jgi:hypothetical protein